MQFTLSINQREHPIACAQVLEQLLAEVQRLGVADVWLTLQHGPVLCCLANHNLAWLMFLRDQDGDAGFSSRNPEFCGPPETLALFRLGNGQTDERPASQCIETARALDALRQFFQHGDKPSCIQWHDDGLALG